MVMVIVLRGGLCVGVCLLSRSCGATALSGGRWRERWGGGAVQGNQEGKIDKWLIAFTLAMETDTVRDRERNMETNLVRNRERD